MPKFAPPKVNQYLPAVVEGQPFDVSQRPPVGFRDPLRQTRAKVQADVKQMLLGALDALGGQAYLERQAIENPVAFMSLLGKIIPLQVKATVRYDVDDISDAELVAIACSREVAEAPSGQEESGGLH